MRILRIFLIIQIVKLGEIYCDFYTSIAGLEDLLETEIYLLENYENFIKKVKQRNDQIKSFLEAVEATQKLNKENLTSYYGNPINAFKSIKRCTLEFPSLEATIFQNHDANDYTEGVDQMKDLDYVSATKDDLIGASKALVRLQSTYALEAAELAEGKLLDYEYDAKLSAHDCFELGLTLYDANDTQNAGQWLLQARSILKTNLEKFGKTIQQEFPFLDDIEILEHLAANMFESGKRKLAKLFNEELLAQDPDNEYGLANAEHFADAVLEERENDLLISDQLLKENQPTVDQIYEAVCRGELKQTPREQRTLSCRYDTRGLDFGRLAPFKMEELNHEPFVAFYHDAIYENEMEKIINVTIDSMERSQIGDREQSKFSEGRTSQNAWLEYDEHEFLRPIQQRLRDITGLDLEHGEPLQVVNYGIGGHYMPHDDFSEDPTEDYPVEGNRLLTALFYINDVELGGATAFPFLKLAVPPIRGGLLVWYNMHESLELDYRVRHAGCPVIKGSKWICNEWFHERGQEFSRPCSLKLQGELSTKYKDEI